MHGPVRSAYMDIVERRGLGDNFYRVTIAANERIRQPPELDSAASQPRTTRRTRWSCGHTTWPAGHLPGACL